MSDDDDCNWRDALLVKAIGVGLFILAALHWFEVWGLRFPDFQP